VSEIVSFQQPADPHSVEAEQMVLGAILLGQPTDAVQGYGGVDLFYEGAHAEIYKTCRRLERDGKLVSPVTVKAAMSDDLKEILEPVGGAAYLAQLYTVVPSAMHAETYAMRVHDAAVSMMSAVSDAMQEIYAAYSGEERRIVSSGIGAVDYYVPGFAPGEMWLIGGRPSMGKTAVALSMGLNAARAGHPVVIASLEMTPQAMAMRALSEGTARQKNAISYTNLRSGKFAAQQGESLKAAAREVAELPIVFLPREYQDTDLLHVGVKQSLRRMNTEKLPLIVVDYAQLLRSKAKSRYEQITDVSLALKGMAMTLEAPVVALSQLSRALEQREDKRPIMSDLRESGQLEQDADGVMFCYRDEYYLEREEPDASDLETYEAWQSALAAQRNRLEIIIAKQRQGAIGTARVRFNPALNLIWEDR